MLEALFPGRIDLGIGRAPGTDPITSLALRRRQDIRDDDDFLGRLEELILFEQRGFPEGHPFRNVRAMPADCRTTADLPAWIERIQRGAGCRDRGGLCFRAPLRHSRRGCRNDELPQRLPAVVGARPAARNPRRCSGGS
jgi:hypothetical protein